MERKPLLHERADHSSIEDTDDSYQRVPRPPLRSSISYDQLPPSIAGYFGENYPNVITPPRSSRTDSNEKKDSSSYSESTQLLPERKQRQPIFIYLVSFIDLIILVYSCAAGGIEKVGFMSELETKTFSRFGFINNLSFVKDQIGVYPGINIFIGPDASFLVRLGAMFPLCIREYELIAKSIKDRKEKEQSFICCSYNRECGMMNKSRCTSTFPGKVIGDQSNCTSKNPMCSSGVTLRPCCIGLHAECEIMSHEKCSILKGQWHSEKLVCSDVNCLDHTCGMTGAQQTHGNQGYRLITPIFIHLGILHLFANLIFQVIFGRKIELEIGTWRTAVIYLISGLGGNLFHGIFTPLLPQAGSSGALFGFLAVMLVCYIRYYNILQKPFWDLCILASIILFSFALGTIPYIGNFVHIGGFVFGVLTTIILLPRLVSTNALRLEHFWRTWILKGIALSLLIAFTLAGFILLYKSRSDFCPACQFLDCIPWTKNFCPNMNSDGYLNTDES